MATAAKVSANRRNAAKSTGPCTIEGKAAAAQNAVKHGLWARAPVLMHENPQEFELHRTRMLRKLAPDGPDQEAMAERIVALWWRLKRAERMQDEALDYLIEADRGDGWVKCRRENGDPSARAELAFGRAVARDFAEARTLDRLTMHERRIKSSLYRTMKELRQAQRERKAEAGEGQAWSQASRSTGILPVTLIHGRDAHATETPCGVTANRVDSARQSQFAVQESEHSPPCEIAEQSQSPAVEGGHSPPCETAKQSQSQGVSSSKCEGSSGAGLAAEDSLSRETKPIETAGTVCSAPAGASRSTGILPVTLNHGRDAHATETPCGVTTSGAGPVGAEDLSCQTNPIPETLPMEEPPMQPRPAGT